MDTRIAEIADGIHRMHDPSVSSDGATALDALAGEYDRRVQAAKPAH